MPNLNKVMLMGNLTRDPELRYTPNNTPVCQLGIAVNRRWTDRNSNEQREETTFVDCDAFGRTAEVLSQYLRKGRPVYLEGRLKLDQWEDQQGNKRSKLRVVVETFQFIDSRGGGDGGSGGGDNYAPARQSRPRQQQAPPPQEDFHQPVDDDEIPF